MRTKTLSVVLLCASACSLAPLPLLAEEVSIPTESTLNSVEATAITEIDTIEALTTYLGKTEAVGTLKLTADLSTGTAIEINAGFEGTLDFNGHTLTCTSASINFIANNGTLTLTDSTEAATGGITTTPPSDLTTRPGKTQITNNGTLSITGGTYNASTTRWLMNTGTIETISGKTVAHSGDYNVLANNGASAVIKRIGDGSDSVKLYAENTTLINASALNTYPAQVIFNNIGRIELIDGGVYDASGCTASPTSGGALVVSATADGSVGTIQNATIKGAYMGINVKYGTVEAIKDCSVESGGAALAVYAGTVTNPVTGCTFKTTSDEVKDPTVFLGANSALTLEKNTVINTVSGSPAIQNGGTAMTLTDNTLIVADAATPAIYASFVKPLGASASSVTGISTTVNATTVKISSTGEAETATAGALIVWQSTDSNRSPTTVMNTPNALIVGDGTGTITTGEGLVNIGDWVGSSAAVARIGTVGYESLGEAFTASKAGDTLTVLKDCNLVCGVGEAEARVETTSGLTITRAITLDGAGHTLTLPVEADTSDYNQGYLLLAADVTFKDIRVESTLAHPVRVSGYNGDAEDYAWVLTLEGENTITGGIGVYSEDDGTLKITGPGNLVVDADGFAGAAGIGGDGAVAAHTCGDIILAGTGAITATGGKCAAALGGGGDTAASYKSAQASTGSVTILSGTVTAYGSEYYAASIGSGNRYDVKSIVIDGGTVTAQTKDWQVADDLYNMSAAPDCGAGIGTYSGPSVGGQVADQTITISGADTVVVAKGGLSGCGIGGALNVSVRSIAITDATVTAVGQCSAAGIGSGNYGGGSGIITIGGSAKVIAEAVSTRLYEGGTAETYAGACAAGAAIGGGYANRANVTIGGEAQVLAINAGAGAYEYWGEAKYTAFSQVSGRTDPTGAAIGTGRIPCYPAYTSVALGAYPDQVVIQDSARVWAYGGQGGAGIGGGHDTWAQNGIQYGTPMNFPNITISGSAQVVAVGGTGASAIGGGHHAQNGGQIAIASTATISATAGAVAEGGTVPAAIGTGSYNAAWPYCPSQGNSGAVTVAATQPTTTLTVETEDAVTALAIVTRDSAGNATSLSDSPGLAINLKQGENVQSVTRTEGSLTGNAIVAEATRENPVSTATDESGTVTHTLALDGANALAEAQTEAGSAYLAAANGDVVARLDTVEREPGTKTTTLAVLNPALALTGSAALVTQNASKADTEEVSAKAWLLNAELAFTSDGGSSVALTYAYEFGIEAFTVGAATAEGIPLTSVTIGLKEGTGEAASARNGRLNGTLNIYANGTKLTAFAVKTPTFTDGTCRIVPENAPRIAPAAGEQTISLTVKLEP